MLDSFWDRPEFQELHPPRAELRAWVRWNLNLVIRWLIDGRPPNEAELQVFRRITVPTILPTIVVVATYMVINAMKVFDIVFVMGNPEGRGTEVIAERMIAWFFIRGNNGRGGAIAVVLFLAIIPVMIWNIRRFREQESIR